MATGPRYRVHFARRRKGKTDYRARKKLLKSDLPRGVVRASGRYITVQFVRYDPKGDEVLASAHTKELKKMGWTKGTSNTSAAYLVGLLAGKRAVEKKLDKAVLDIGLHAPTRGSKVYAVLQGMVDAGLDIPHDPSVIPDESRIKGETLGEDVPKIFESVSKNIRGGE